MLCAMHIVREFEQSSFKQLSFDKFYLLWIFLLNNFLSDNLLGRIFVEQFSVYQYTHGILNYIGGQFLDVFMEFLRIILSWLKVIVWICSEPVIAKPNEANVQVIELCDRKLCLWSRSSPTASCRGRRTTGAPKCCIRSQQTPPRLFWWPPSQQQ